MGSAPFPLFPRVIFTPVLSRAYSGSATLFNPIHQIKTTDRVTPTDGQGSSGAPLISNPPNQVRCRLRPPRHDQMVRDHRDRKPRVFRESIRPIILLRKWRSEVLGNLPKKRGIQNSSAYQTLTERRRESVGHPPSLRYAVADPNRSIHSGERPYQNLGRLGSIAPTYNPSEHLDRLYLRDC